MTRWEPNARERLEQAAMELYGQRGFDQTTVAEIAARAGLTERTFFRYFADKREVLFGGAARLEELLTGKVASAPEGAAPIDAVAAALEATAPLFEQRQGFAQKRHALIAGHPELRERELIKLASLASAIAAALRHRGVPQPAASLAADMGIAIFKLAFEHWVEDSRKKDLAHHVRESLKVLRGVTEGRAVAAAGASSSRAARAPRGEGTKRRRSR